MSAIREHVLSNGMTILCWHQPYLRGLEMGLYLKGGSIYETEETQGISHLLEHLCFRGLGGLNHEMGAKFAYFSADEHTFMGFGGLRYMEVVYTDAEWADFVAANNNDLSAEYKKSE